ncbi:lytic murein transglycosylase [Acinetobacter sp. RF15A]|uniref:lytic murein transglycosylase n=1 Tax=unclassified Acinetobacter TaxID=196816 RepID=UPI001193FC93|nr:MULTISPECIES: lytic murein transglycosylase [unclassified Acinetobacter]TSH71282.1 lytic murein transglycosylase [Acinetobacter sp. RF15A]TSI15191.1 lytic murein transglycosylase [Acinetobacter sp. RF15B]
MQRLALSIGSLLLAASQAQAELVINGQRVAPTDLSSASTVISNNPVNYAAQNDFQRCLANLRGRAIAQGVSGASYDRYTQHLSPDYSVIEKLNYQPEFSTPIWDYLSGLVDEERVQLGRQKLQQHRDVLNRVSAVYGVPAETIVAVWGVESNFGDISGKYPLLQSLGTLSCEGRRQGYFQGEFFTTMKLLQRGDVREEQLKGSWAGAFGHTQFMPSTYNELAVDFDGDGRRDLVSSIPDALASTANFLSKRGWQTGQPWGFEVKIPQNMSISGEGRRNKKSLGSWVNRGLVRADGTALVQGNLSEASQAGLLAPAGPNGPIFLVFKNFDAIYSYNAAESYALAIAHLSDRLQGKGGLLTAWPTDDPGTSRMERREIQQFLLNRGHDIGTVDGLIGDKTRQAIRQEQIRLGLNPTGRAGQQILRAFRNENAKLMMR